MSFPGCVTYRGGRIGHALFDIRDHAPQVDFLKLLYDKLNELHTLWANSVHEPQFPRPLFKVGQQWRYLRWLDWSLMRATIVETACTALDQTC